MRASSGALQTIVVLVVVLATSSGCAHRVVIRSNPEGARIWVDGKLEGESPVVVERHTSTGERLAVRAELENFETSTTVVQQTDWFWWPAMVAVTPALAVPFVVIPVAGPIITVGWACVTSPTLLSLAFLQKYPDQVTVRLRPRIEGGLVLPTDGWTVPVDYDPNPPPPGPPLPAPPAPPPVVVPPPVLVPEQPAQPEGGNPVP